MPDKKYTLPRDFAEKWVAALRSGEYKQGKENLGNKESGYCCIGVAAVVCGATDEMFLKSNMQIAQFISGNNSVPHFSTDRIPADILINIPYQITGGRFGLVAELTVMNDHQGKTFPEIADWIEQNVEFV